MCFYCRDMFPVDDPDDDDVAPVCLMCRKAHRFAFEPGSRVKHKRLTHLRDGAISDFQPDLLRGIVYVAWDNIPPGLPGSGVTLAGLPCPDRTLGHGWNTLQPLDDAFTTEA